jgi:hypothetical protein
VTTLFKEFATAGTAYPALPGVNGMGISGGIGIHRGLGVALHFDAVHYDNTVGLGVTVPSPFFFFNTTTADAPTATTLARDDHAVDMSAVYTVLMSDNRLSVRAFGGPTYFHVTNNMVEIIQYNQLANVVVPINVVAITAFTQREVSGSALGFNAGADVSWFFTRYVGAGGGLRFNRGTVTVLEPLRNKNADLKVGQAQFGAGLRLRF